jgi:molybdate transport system substrate-binding protein
MGDSPEAIPTRLARGETADVVILDGGALDDLAKQGLVHAGSKVDLARSLIGVVVREGAAKPDIGSVDALRGALLAAKSIAYSDSGSGTYLSTTLFPKLGIAEQIARKTQKVRGPPSGEPVAAVVARGEAEIGFQQVAELIHVPGVAFVSTIPAEARDLLRRRSYKGRPRARGGQCADPLPRITRGRVHDFEGRIDAAAGPITRFRAYERRC